MRHLTRTAVLDVVGLLAALVAVDTLPSPIETRAPNPVERAGDAPGRDVAATRADGTQYRPAAARLSEGSA